MQSNLSAGGEIIRVLVADDTRIHTQLLAEALRRDSNLEVISPPVRLKDFVETVKRHKVDVSVLSSNLDEEPMRGFELLRQLRAADPGVLAIMLLESSKRESVLQAFRAGARGIFSRNDSLETLSKCIRSVRAGQIWANSEQMTFAVEALATSPTLRAVDASGLSLLSKREMDVVRSLAEGLTNREIAERLGLSQHTVKNYLFRVYDKLGVSSRLELLFMTLTQAGSPRLKGAASPIYSPVRHETQRPARSDDDTKVAGSLPTFEEETAVSIPESVTGKRKSVVVEDHSLKSDQTRSKAGTTFIGADPLS